MNFTSYTAAGYATPQAIAALGALRATGTGTGTVAFVPTWYMRSPRASTLAPDAAKTPDDAALLEGMRVARELGMSVAVKPHVDVRGDSFRGAIAPRDPRAWFAAYRAMIARYATLAQEGGAKLFVVGDELTSLSGRTPAWRAVIALVRKRFHGRLTYAANWVDEAERVAFWKQLDAIGIDGYMPLLPRGHPNPSLARLRAGWKPYKRRLAALHARTKKSVLFTELGYQSVAQTAASPNAGGRGPTDQRAQAKAYEAAFQVWSRVRWCQGIYWWDWSADGLNARSSDRSHRPAGKLAERVLRHWYGAALPPVPRAPASTK